MMIVMNKKETLMLLSRESKNIFGCAELVLKYCLLSSKYLKDVVGF